MKKEHKTEELPNIIYVGEKTAIDKKTLKPVTRKALETEIPRWRRNGNRVFHLPEGKDQLKGFYHKDAMFLISAYRGEFKRFVKKGE